ncbi:MAG: DUF5686 family protein [Bacteroidota bacterium]
MTNLKSEKTVLLPTYLHTTVINYTPRKMQLYFTRCLSYLLVLLGVCTTSYLSAQTSDKLTKVKGIVIDQETKEPLPFVAIAFAGTSIGTTTDFDGKYELSTQFATESLEISFIGYTTKTVPVKLGEKQVIDVELAPEALTFEEEVVVKAKKKRYRKKNNPAVDLMRKVIANKDKNSLEQYDHYEYDKYEKVELDINNITDKFRNRKAFKKFQFIFDYVDTSEVNGKPYLPIFLQEIDAKVYYSKEKDKKREYREAIKATKLENHLDEESVTTIMDYLYDDIDIYSGSTILMGNQFTMPLSPIALDFYRFYIIDTIEYEGKQAIDMAFIPKVKGNFGFNGNLYIALDSTYQLLKATMGVVDDINLNFVQDLLIEQEFKPAPNGKYVVALDRIIVDYNLTKKGIGAFGQRTARYYNHVFNEPQPDEIYDVPEFVIEKKGARKVKDDYWQDNRPVELSEKEAGVYQMIDTLKRVPAFKRALNIVSFLSTGYTPVGKFDVGPINSFYGGNAVEGFRARFGGRTNINFHPKLALDAYVAYGFRDKEFKGAFKALWSFNENSEDNPKHYIEAGFTRETKFPGLKVDFISEDNVFLAIGRRGIADRMLLYTATRLDHYLETRNNLTFHTTIERLKQLPIGRLTFDFTGENGEPASLEAIRTTEFGFNFRWAPNADYFQGKINRYPIFNKHPIFQFSYYGAPKGVFGSEYSYHQFRFGAFKRFYLSFLGYTNVDFEMGKFFGKNLPYTILHIPRANQSYLYQIRSFNMMNFLEFASDQYVKINFRHYFNGFIFNRIPLFKKLKLREVVTLKMIYGGLSDDNNPDKNPGLIQFTNQIDENGEVLLDENGEPLKETFTLEDKPYIEGSVGILNIFKVLRIDLVKRFTYLDNPNLPRMFGVDGLGLRARVYVEF